jgi:hypothetical protein
MHLCNRTLFANVEPLGPGLVGHALIFARNLTGARDRAAALSAAIDIVRCRRVVLAATNLLNLMSPRCQNALHDNRCHRSSSSENSLGRPRSWDLGEESPLDFSSREIMAVPNGASCYICLDEGPDEAGISLVRDCSCRGDAMGLAHLSCIVKYAEQKSEQEADRSPAALTAFAEPWRMCPNCKQPYKSKLSLDVSSAFVQCAEAAYGYPGNGEWDKMKVLAALRSKVFALLFVLSEGTKGIGINVGSNAKNECEMHIKTMLIK